jgi:hypothetical protein
LKLKCAEPLSNIAFSFNLRRYIMAVRFMAGVSSPLVACLLYIFERARDKMHALEGVNAYSVGRCILSL